MHHEPSPFHSSDAASNGWVGIADSLVGGLALILIVALAAASQLNVANQEVKSLKEKLKLSEEIRTTLDNDLRSALELIAELERDLSLMRQQVKDRLNEQTRLLAKIKELEQELNEQKKKVAEVKLEVERLEPRAKILDEIVAQFKSNDRDIVEKLKKMQQEFEQSKLDLQAANKDLAKLKERAKILDRVNELFSATDADIVAKLKKIIPLLAPERQVADDEIKLKRKTYEDLLNRAKLYASDVNGTTDQPTVQAVHAKLASIKGRLSKVVIVLDFSGSMLQPRGGDEKDRWTTAKSFIDDVCAYLDMDECVLVVFSDNIVVHGRNHKAEPWPSADNSKLATLRKAYTTRRPLTRDESEVLYSLGQLSPNEEQAIRKIEPFRITGETNDRQAFKDLVASLPKPQGGTNTLKALNAAFMIEGATNILLFTDGEPGLIGEILSAEARLQEQNGARFKPADFPLQKQWIYDAVDRHLDAIKKQQKTPPIINAIGIGDYFDDDLARFLRTLSENKTGGSFQGR